MAENQNVEYGIFEMPKKQDWEENMTEKEKNGFCRQYYTKFSKRFKEIVLFKDKREVL